MSILPAITKAIARRNLSAEEMESAMRIIMQGEATPAQIAGLLVALRMKGETVEEIAAAARVMRGFARKVEIDVPHLVDIVGTGGDASNTFNVSTTAAFVTAAAGGNVAKHNNRSVSSRSGSADVLEKAGVTLGLDPAHVAACIRRVGIGFMFAPAHHGATRHAAGPRRELGMRTIFNVLGPLTNPAGVLQQLVGVFSPDLVGPIAEVLGHLGSRHSLVVHSADGLDEISIAAPTAVAELNEGGIHFYEISPEDFGLKRGALDAIRVSGADESLSMMRSVLANEPGPARDIVQLNAGAAIYAAGVAPDLKQGVVLAGKALASGAAREKLSQLAALSGQLAAGSVR